MRSFQLRPGPLDGRGRHDPKWLQKVAAGNAGKARTEARPGFWLSPATQAAMARSTTAISSWSQSRLVVWAESIWSTHTLLDYRVGVRVASESRRRRGL
jgi:hypothetical protein